MKKLLTAVIVTSCTIFSVFLMSSYNDRIVFIPENEINAYTSLSGIVNDSSDYDFVDERLYRDEDHGHEVRDAVSSLNLESKGADSEHPSSSEPKELKSYFTAKIIIDAAARERLRLLSQATGEYRYSSDYSQAIEFGLTLIERQHALEDLQNEHQNLKGSSESETQMSQLFDQDTQQAVLDVQRQALEPLVGLMQNTQFDSVEARQFYLNELLEDHEAALSSVLTPKDKEKYDLYYSPKALKLRFLLGQASVSEDEMAQLLNIEKAQNQESQPGVDEAALSSVSGNESKIRSILGEERFALYQRNRDQSLKTQ